MKKIVKTAIIILLSIMVVVLIINSGHTSHKTSQNERMEDIAATFTPDYDATVEYGTPSCNPELENESDNCDSLEMTDAQKQKFIDDCSQIKGVFDGDNTCQLPVIVKLIKYEPSKYSFYDYIVTAQLRFENSNINLKKLHSLNMYATNYSSIKIKNADPNNPSQPQYQILPNLTNSVGSIITKKIKLENKEDAADINYTVQ